VVTDCNMPEMDGYELTRAIRAAEASEGRARTPIIACTANAIAGELQKCRDAGMDDFVAKPVELQALAGVMGRRLPLPAGEGVSPVNASSLAEVSGGDAAMEREILVDFRTANQSDMAKLREVLARRDMKGIAQTAHRVKGACRTIGAVALAEICERVEGAAKQADRQAVAAEQRALELEFERLDAWLAEQASKPMEGMRI
jgi:CheY-like chemotaxis protein